MSGSSLKNLDWRVLIGSSSGYTVTGPILPFELWRIIFLELFEDLGIIRQRIAAEAAAAPKLHYLVSDLHARLEAFKLLWVSKYWYAMARDVFYEDLHAETSQSLQGIRNALIKERHLGGAIQRIQMSFPTFRDTESEPRRPLPCQLPEGIDPEGPQAKALERKLRTQQGKRRFYRPSNTKQPIHWTRWQGLCRDVLMLCPALQDIKVIFTSDFTTQDLPRRGGDYKSLWGSPDLNMEGLLNGLRSCSNLRHLHFIDPSPLEEYGPALQLWKRLKSATIDLSQHFTQISMLPETVFYPPRDLEELRIHDHSSGAHHWPLESDIARCTDLKVLDLGIAVFEQANTVAAVSFLIWSYQSTLTDLTLGRLWSHHQGPPAFHPSFTPIFTRYSDSPPYNKLRFPNLVSLRLLSNESVAIFASFEAHQLMDVEVGAFSGDGPNIEPESDEAWVEWWQAKLSVPSLGRLRTFKMWPNGEHEHSISEACHALGITFSVDRPGEAPWDDMMF